MVIDAKIDQKFDASWDRFLGGFGRILEAKMEPCWHPNQSTIDATCEKRFFEKSCSPDSGGLIFWVREIQVGSKHQLKSIKKGVQHGKASWYRFLNDFGGFWEGKWRQVGTQVDQKSMPIAKSDFLKNRALPAVGA